MKRAAIAAVLAAALGGCFLERAALGPDGGTQPTPPPPDGGARDAATTGDSGQDGGPPTPLDRDGDGVPDDEDLCPDDPAPETTDSDRDGIGDRCDDDRDGDGLPNDRDLCPDVNSFGAPDEDGDGITDDCDLCPLDADPDQPNADGDRLGDACEDADPTRLSRVAFLATFATGLDGFAASSGPAPAIERGGVHVDTSGTRTLLRGRDPAFPGDYAIDVRGRYERARGDGTFAVLLRWSSGDVEGYALGVRGGDDEAAVVRVDQCTSFFGLITSTCVETLASQGVSASNGIEFALRATAMGSDLSLVARLGDATVTASANDPEYVTGEWGLLVQEADVRFHSLAVYAP